MNKTFRVILALVLVFTMVGALGVAALADGEPGETKDITLILTGGTDRAIGGEGLNFAAAAALRDTYATEDEAEEAPVLLVDAGGFLPEAAAILAAAEYDLIVPEAALTEWDIGSISMGVSGLSAGVVFSKAGLQIAFVGVVPMGEQDAAEYYAAIQAAVTTALERGVDYVVALGLVEDAAKLVANVTGLNAVLTYGAETSVKTLPEEAPVDAEAAGGETDGEEALVTDGEGEEPAPARTLVVTVGEKFAAIGVVTVNAEGITAETLDAESLAVQELTLDEEIVSLEAEILASLSEDTAEETVEETEETAEETEETAEETEESVEETEESTEETEEPAQETEESVQETETAPVEAAAGTAQETETTEEEADTTAAAPTEPTPMVSEASDSDLLAAEQAAAANVEPVETVVWDGEAEQEQDSPTEYTKDENKDLELVFEHPVSAVKVGDRVFETQYYDKSEDGRTVKIHADVLNGWNNATYTFIFEFSDGAESKNVQVVIQGNPPADDPTPTPSPTPTPTPSPTPAPTKGNSPSTGDSSPIALYVVLLVVLVAALAVVIVLVIRKNKRTDRD